MARVEIITVPELRKAIKKADVIWAVIRFGSNEEWSKISKKAALEMVSRLDDDETPEGYGIYGGDAFGILDNNELSLG